MIDMLDNMDTHVSDAPGHGCYTIDKYNAALDAGYFIKNGLWWADEYNTIGPADPREIEIAALFEAKFKVSYNRFVHLED